jgi:uncharacterized membrane protein YgcG
LSGTRRTFEITEEYVEQRFPEVVERIRKENRPMRRRTAVRWLRETLHFLDACAEAEEPISPSKRVDKAWHEFILHTELYSQWCQSRYGRYIHHTPYAKPDAAAYRRTYALLRERHGQLDSRIWPNPFAAGVIAGGGGACSAGSCGGGSCSGGSCGGGGCGGGGCGGGGGG